MATSERMENETIVDRRSFYNLLLCFVFWKLCVNKLNSMKIFDLCFHCSGNVYLYFIFLNFQASSEQWVSEFLLLVKNISIERRISEFSLLVEKYHLNAAIRFQVSSGRAFYFSDNLQLMSRLNALRRFQFLHGRSLCSSPPKKSLKKFRWLIWRYYSENRILLPELHEWIYSEFIYQINTQFLFNFVSRARSTLEEIRLICIWIQFARSLNLWTSKFVFPVGVLDFGHLPLPCAALRAAPVNETSTSTMSI
jgi:hypothetical protein